MQWKAFKLGEKWHIIIINIISCCCWFSLESSLRALESAEQRDTGASYCLCGTVLQAALLGTISKYLRRHYLPRTSGS